MSGTPTSRVSIILTLSLILNGMLAGFLIGGNLRQERPPPPPDGGERALMRALESNVAEADRSGVRDALRTAYRATRNERMDLRQARRNLRIALAADPYDFDAVIEAFEAVRTAETTARIGLHDELARQFEDLSAEERVSVLRTMDRPIRRDPRRGGPRSIERPIQDTDN